MFEILKLIATLCTVNAINTASFSSADQPQRECQAELSWCVGKEEKLTPTAALSGCIVKRAVDHGWKAPK